MLALTSIFLVLILLFFAVALFGGFFVYIYWWLIQRPVPQVTGRLDLPGFAAPVEILRDKHGIPHIYAQNEMDLWRAQGVVHAQDRLWQMEQQRRMAAGRMAELFGPAALDADRFARTVGFYRAAQAELDSLDPESRSRLDAYVDGINAYMGSRPGRLAAEFNLLRRQPEPWRAEDTLAVMKLAEWSQSLNWESELVRLQLAQSMDPLRAADLEPDYPPDSPVMSDWLGSDEALRLAQVAGLLLSEYDKCQPHLPRGGGQGGGLGGSNAWAIAGRFTVTERPFLCGDPHLALTMPGIWYENHLSAPGLEICGVSRPGVPGVIMGHNGHIAWASADGRADTQDLYFDTPAHPADIIAEFTETIPVRKGESHTERVRLTRHGPLISGLVQAGQGIGLSLRWAGHEPGRTLAAIFALNRATGWDEFRAALSQWEAAPQSFVYADGAGNIGCQVAGRLPIRAKGLGLLPSLAWQEEYGWQGFVPFDELPHIFNPPSGMIVAANQKPVGDDFPYFWGVEVDPGWRAQRIGEMLRVKKKMNWQDMARIQQDTTSLYAERLTPLLTLQESQDPYVKIAINALRNWGFRMEPASDAPLIFHYTLLHLLEMTFGDKLGAAYGGFRGERLSPIFAVNGFVRRAETRLLSLLRGEEESVWYTEMATGRPRSRDELICEALERAVKRIRREVNATPRHWAWGRMHQVRWIHPMGSVRILGGYFNRGPFPIGGDGTTPMLTDYAPHLPPGLAQTVASYRQIIDAGHWDAMQSVTTSGQSGHPLSPHYADQTAMWVEGDYHPLPWSRDGVEKAAVGRLVIG